MKVKVKFLAVLAPLAKEKEYHVELGEEATLSNLLLYLRENESEQLLKRLFDNGELSPDVLVFVSGVEVSLLGGMSAKLKDGDEVVFLPTVHGG